MDAISTNELLNLTRHQAERCVSVYMPTHPTGADGQQDLVRWRNLLHQIANQLVEGGLPSGKAKELLQPARDLETDSAFWKERSYGLAAFISTNTFCRFRLPRRFDELTAVNCRFYVKPLLPLLSGTQRFFILALSQNDVRLFEASQFQILQLDVDALPGNIKAALNYTSVDRGQQVHPAMKGSGALGKQAVVFHGQGGEKDTHKDELVQFFRLVDAAIHPVLTAASAPLLLAGVAYLLPIYREICSYPHVAEEQLEGNCDHLTPNQLRERAFPLVEPVLQQNREKAAKRYIDLAGTSLASDDIARILGAAYDGRVDILFIDSRIPVWGSIRIDDRMVEVHKSRQIGDDDLIDLAATQSLLHRGMVYSVEHEQLPSHGSVAALFRY